MCTSAVCPNGHCPKSEHVQEDSVCLVYRFLRKRVEEWYVQEVCRRSGSWKWGVYRDDGCDIVVYNVKQKEAWECIQNRAAAIILGCNRHTCSDAMSGELGWHKLDIG